MGALTDDQLRQIAASSNKGISESVRAAEKVGQEADKASAANLAYASLRAELLANRPTARRVNTGMVIAVTGVSVVGLYLLLRPRKGRKKGA